MKTQQVTKRTPSVILDSSVSYVQLDRNRLLCVGTENKSSIVYLVELPSLQFSRLLPQSTPRSNTGLVKVKAHIYAFGGDNLRSCEKMEIETKHWTHCGNMTHPRNSFTPCLFRSLIYLASNQLIAVETFDPESETFAVLPVSIPPTKEKKASVTFIYNGELCYLDSYSQRMARWKIDTEREFRITNERIFNSKSPAKRFLISGSLALLVGSSHVYHFSLETYSLVKKIEFR